MMMEMTSIIYAEMPKTKKIKEYNLNQKKKVIKIVQYFQGN